MPQRDDCMAKVYPRPDTYYRNKHSLNFDMMRTKIFMERKSSGASIWWVHCVCGFAMGFVGFTLTWLETTIIDWKFNVMQSIIDSSRGQAGAYFFLITVSCILALMAAVVCIYYAPASMGSGVAEVMGLLNGINYNGAIEFRTFFGKYFGVLFAICSGLCIGMEGPLVHMGAIVGVAACYIPGKWYEYLQNDVHRR